jgi:hypothetical protein
MRMALKISTETLDELDCEGLVLVFFSDERPPRGLCGFADWRLNGIISRYLKEGRITGAFLEKILIPSQERVPCERILLLGLGKSAELTYDQLYTAGYTISETVTGMGWREIALNIPSNVRCVLDVPVMTEAMITGYVDFCNENLKRCSIQLTGLLADSSDLDGVLSGLERFRRNTGETANVDVHL